MAKNQEIITGIELAIHRMCGEVTAKARSMTDEQFFSDARFSAEAAATINEYATISKLAEVAAALQKMLSDLGVDHKDALIEKAETAS